MGNPNIEVQRFGQSFWYDNIQRSVLANGELKQLIDDYGVLGLTSNPSIFDKAISNSSDYDDDILAHARAGRDANAIYEQLAIADIRAAADLLGPVYERTHGVDGYVSLEVSPELARDADGTIEEARRLFKAVGRKNLMIKVPATPECIPAVEQLISDGINVNVTLIFLCRPMSRWRAHTSPGCRRGRRAGSRSTSRPSRRSSSAGSTRWWTSCSTSGSPLRQTVQRRPL